MRAQRPVGGATPHVRVAIVGAGFGGLGAAIRLRQRGIDDLVLLDRADGVGGTWWANRYPGAACDVQSRLYEFAFAPNPDWGRRYAGRAEIQSYLRRCADEFGITPHLRLGRDVLAAAWHHDERRWHVETTGGDWTADVLVAAAGALSEPRVPELPGRDSFAGTVVHTARWDDAIDVAGRHVAVVGTGASAIQVVPGIQPDVAHLTLFQRTPPWVLPRGDRPLSPRAGALLGRAPALHRAIRGGLFAGRELFGLPFRHPWLTPLPESVARAHLARQVSDPALRDVLTPDYRIGCKRVLLSDDYYPALTRPNVTVVDGPVTAVRPDGVVGPDGTAHPADLLVLATGFRATSYPFGERVHGRDGVRLSDVWTPSLFAHLGTTVSGFPNLFVLLGPNTGLAHSSVVLMIEAQIAHLVNAVAALDARGAAAVEPRPEAQQAFVDDVQRRLRTTVWNTGGCGSWYLDATGRNTTLWPGSVRAFQRRVAPFDPGDHRWHAPMPAHGERRSTSVSPAPTATGRAVATRTVATRTVAPSTVAPRTLAPRAGATRAVPTAPDRYDGPRTTGGDPLTPTPIERLAGGAARRLRRLPDGVVTWLGGGPATVDGETLDPMSLLVARLRGERDLSPGSPATTRARQRRNARLIAARPDPTVTAAEVAVDGADGLLPARHFRSPDPRADDVPLLLYLHGGGFTLGDLDTLDRTCRLLCREARQHVLSVAYRLAPEHQFPAAVRDAEAALRWAQAHAAELGGDGSVAVGGDSAGATLATVTARRTAHDHPPAAQLVIYPATDRTRRRPSHDLFDGYFLTMDDLDHFTTAYYGGTGTPDGHPDISPLCADLAGVAPALTVTAHFDVLRDEGLAYADALRAAAARSVHHHEPRLAHGFVQLIDVSGAARRATVAVARRWRRLLTERWPA